MAISLEPPRSQIATALFSYITTRTHHGRDLLLGLAQQPGPKISPSQDQTAAPPSLNSTVLDSKTLCPKSEPANPAAAPKRSALRPIATSASPSPLASPSRPYHQAEITLHRTGKSGTAFRISIPGCDQECGLAEPCCEPLPLDLPEERRPKARLQVLVADDEEYITRMVQEALRESLHARVIQVATAETAIEHLATDKFDLIISDVRLPGIGGLGLLTWLRQHRPDALSRLLFITGDAGGAEMNQNLETSGISVLRKPFRIRELVDRTQSLLEITNF